MKPNIPSPLQQLRIAAFEKAGLEIWVKRDDLINEYVSGNKWRKLNENIAEAKKRSFKKILTFGGAYSNHIAAVGAIAKHFDFEFYAMIRGEELDENSNQTLRQANENGVSLHFIDRSNYKDWNRFTSGDQISKDWEDFYIVPEGGSNEFGVSGCEEIINEIDRDFDVICLSAGTGTTAAGILRSIDKERLMVFPALKNGGFLRNDILSWQGFDEKKDLLELVLEYHFGGYAKVTKELVEFTRGIKQNYDLPLDYIYTAKAFYGLIREAEKGRFRKGTKILFYHSGGLQGNRIFDEKY